MSKTKNRRIPSPFMLYVKENKEKVMKKYPFENENVLGEYLGQKWRSLGVEEKKVYYDRHNSLKRSELDKIDCEAQANQEIESDLSIPSTSRKMDMEVKSEVLEPEKKNKKTIKDLSTVASTSKKWTDNIDFKEKPKKKVRRSPNPFLIFAKEHRSNISSTYLKDKKCHSSTILSNMWKVLPPAEKKFYTEKAQKLHNLRKKTETVSKRMTPSKKRKVGRGRPKKSPPEPVAGPSNVKQEAAPAEPSTGSIFQASANVQNTAYQQASGLDHHNHTGQLNVRQSQFCWNTSPHLPMEYNYLNNMPQHSTYTAAMSKFCGGAGMAPPTIMPYPFPPFWMYPQMAYQMYMQNCPHFSGWGLPHEYYENSYFSSYCPNRGAGFSNLYQPTSTVSAAESHGQNESASTSNASNEQENSDQELVIVDEDNTNEPSKNDTD